MKQMRRKRRAVVPSALVLSALGIQLGQPCAHCGVSMQDFSLVFANLCAACAVAHWDKLLGNPPAPCPDAGELVLVSELPM
jgi:hypothetical protein